MLKKLKLTKKWNDHHKGETLMVDTKRAKWLKSHGFLDVPKQLPAEKS